MVRSGGPAPAPPAVAGAAAPRGRAGRSRRRWRRFLPDWQGVAPAGPAAGRRCAARPRLERLAEVVDQLAGLPIPASVLERDVLPARIPGYQPRLLDELGALGEVAWVGRGSLGRDDGRIVAGAGPGARSCGRPAPPDGAEPPSEPASRRDPRAPRGARRVVLSRAVRGSARHVGSRGPRRAVGPGVGRRGDERHVRAAARPALEADGERALGASAPAGAAHGARTARGRRPLVAGRPRWSRRPTERLHAQSLALLERHGVLTREAVASRGDRRAGSRPSIRSCGRWRMPAGSGAATSSTASAPPSSRWPARSTGCGRSASRPTAPSGGAVHLLAAADPANPYGAALPWPRRGETDRRPLQRAAGAYVVLVDGVAALYLERGGATLQTLPAADDPDVGVAAARAWPPWSPMAAPASSSSARSMARTSRDRRSASGCSPPGFVAGYRGLVLRAARTGT